MREVKEIVLPDDLIVPEVELVGHDSNALAIIGTVARALKRAGNSREVVDGFRAEAMSDDYDHLLRVAMSYTEQPEEAE
jgi:hypothetical protein